MVGLYRRARRALGRGIELGRLRAARLASRGGALFRRLFLCGPERALLARALAGLEATGVIEYSGEFGAEITTFIPFVHWLQTSGRLCGRRVVTYGGMRPYYFFLDDAQYCEKGAKRSWQAHDRRPWPGSSTYSAIRRPWLRPVDFRARYRDQGLAFERPVLFIQNKFCIEWYRGPVNYIPLDSLETLFAFSRDRFDVVYSCPRTGNDRALFVGDDNADCEYPDLSLARSFKNVLVLEDHCASTGAPFNQTKLEILAKSHLFVGVQGGASHLLACFPDSVLLLLHVEGDEYPHAYAAGPYTYLADPAPILLLTRRIWEFRRGVALMGALTVEGGR
ncbi:MAG: hypothetical protein ACREQ5_33350, partial [Candidatus Dormibacteria bacterium]